MRMGEKSRFFGEEISGKPLKLGFFLVIGDDTVRFIQLSLLEASQILLWFELYSCLCVVRRCGKVKVC